ncbi:16S rRNA (cytidine(1402)-2'-O)-methyltransferase [Bacteroidia bacterium]|nr:16S rRNA (cytidine(1402)-2'-O)-methyltransferase [Bacteroidia bacterium]MDB9881676.1 16S rRNA (cytidine(1402)-2'-O)-methyltransferase [Bacteroidia bacterium]MDC1395394.1 16S rRNA (cytidine(1402)-2'-O)-methyltransferase [Bacteroidia bacterium]
MSSGKLYIVPTPIGNLGDITYRAVEILKSVDAVLAEDTRQTKKLLDHYQIDKKLIPFHQHNEHKNLQVVIDKVKGGETFAVCSDAGMPGISDPGYLLIREAIVNDIEVITLPGAVAAIVALVNSGLPCDTFVYEGFLPHKKGKQTKILNLLEEKRTTIFYESPHRIVKSLNKIKELLGDDRKIVIGRELTKKFEEHIRGTVVEVLDHFTTNAPKGEFVLLVGGYDTK